MSPNVSFKSVTKKFKMYNGNFGKIKDLFNTSEKGEFHYALKDITFEVQPGEIVGIIGLNGAGKSTISNLIAGVTMPSEGTVTVNGSASLIAISSGLNGHLTGIENIELKGLMLGLSKKQIVELTPKIIEFAEIGKFINQPVKTYSSGMKARLGFAISANIDPDILVIDEALSVGDQTFTDRCLNIMNEFKDKGKTIFFISHSLPQVKSFCTKALWLNNGQVQEFGQVEEVVGNYTKFLKEYNKLSKEDKEQFVKNFDTTESESVVSTKNRYIRRKRREENKKTKQWLLPVFLFLTLILSAVMSLASPNNIINDVKQLFVSKTAQHDSDKKKSKDESQSVDTNAKEAAQETVAYNAAVVSRGLVNIRNKPSLDSKIIAQGKFGDSFKIFDKNENVDENITWLGIKLKNGDEAWLSSGVVEEVGSQDHANLNFDDSIFSKLLGDNGLPTSLDGLKKFFELNIDEFKDQYRNDVLSDKANNNREELSLKDFQVVFYNKKIEQITLKKLDQDVVNLKSSLGNPLINDKQVFVYILDELNVKLTTDSSDKITSIEIVPLAFN